MVGKINKVPSGMVLISTTVELTIKQKVGDDGKYGSNKKIFLKLIVPLTKRRKYVFRQRHSIFHVVFSLGFLSDKYWDAIDTALSTSASTLSPGCGLRQLKNVNVKNWTIIQ